MGKCVISGYFLHHHDPAGVMRRFTLGRHCRGRAAVIQADCTGRNCADRGLRFRAVADNNKRK